MHGYLNFAYFMQMIPSISTELYQRKVEIINYNLLLSFIVNGIVVKV